MDREIEGIELFAGPEATGVTLPNGLAQTSSIVSFTERIRRGPVAEFYSFVSINERDAEFGNSMDAILADMGTLI